MVLLGIRVARVGEVLSLYFRTEHVYCCLYPSIIGRHHQVARLVIVLVLELV